MFWTRGLVVVLVGMAPLGAPASVIPCDLYLSVLGLSTEGGKVFQPLLDATPPDQILTRRGARLFLVPLGSRLQKSACKLPVHVPMGVTGPQTCSERARGIAFALGGIGAGTFVAAAGLWGDGFPDGIRALFACAGALCNWAFGVELVATLRAPAQRTNEPLTLPSEPQATAIGYALSTTAGHDGIVWAALVAEKAELDTLRSALLRQEWRPLVYRDTDPRELDDFSAWDAGPVLVPPSDDRIWGRTDDIRP